MQQNEANCQNRTKCNSQGALVYDCLANASKMSPSLRVLDNKFMTFIRTEIVRLAAEEQDSCNVPSADASSFIQVILWSSLHSKNYFIFLLILFTKDLLPILCPSKQSGIALSKETVHSKRKMIGDNKLKGCTTALVEEEN
uniref:Uncharacterized protein n=1 Tax=Glossina pallidipes TaxID=7398 RepID=A0A1A9ZQC2_GLOPL